MCGSGYTQPLGHFNDSSTTKHTHLSFPCLKCLSGQLDYSDTQDDDAYTISSTARCRPCHPLPPTALTEYEGDMASSSVQILSRHKADHTQRIFTN